MGSRAGSTSMGLRMGIPSISRIRLGCVARTCVRPARADQGGWAMEALLPGPQHRNARQTRLRGLTGSASAPDWAAASPNQQQRSADRRVASAPRAPTHAPDDHQTGVSYLLHAQRSIASESNRSERSDHSLHRLSIATFCWAERRPYAAVLIRGLIRRSAGASAFAATSVS